MARIPQPDGNPLGHRHARQDHAAKDHFLSQAGQQFQEPAVLLVLFQHGQQPVRGVFGRQLGRQFGNLFAFGGLPPSRRITAAALRTSGAGTGPDGLV